MSGVRNPHHENNVSGISIFPICRRSRFQACVRDDPLHRPEGRYQSEDSVGEGIEARPQDHVLANSAGDGPRKLILGIATPHRHKRTERIRQPLLSVSSGRDPRAISDSMIRRPEVVEDPAAVRTWCSARRTATRYAVRLGRASSKLYRDNDFRYSRNGRRIGRCSANSTVA